MSNIKFIGDRQTMNNDRKEVMRSSHTTNTTQTIAEKLGVEYIRVGDYLLPNITLSEEADAPPLGKYGMMHKAYLKEHKPALYGLLLSSERLYPLCREVDEAAATRLATIPDKEVAHEVILSELVYV